MSMAHLDPQDPSVFEALQDVMNPKTDTNWFAFLFFVFPLFQTGFSDNAMI